MKLLLTSALIFFALFAGSACQQQKSSSSPTLTALPTCDVKPGSVYDGDTFRVLCQGKESKIRFACIDAPEARQQGGIASRDHLRSLLNKADNKVNIKAVDTDRYGRTVAEVYVNNQLVQLQQVKDGMVWANEKYKSDCPSWAAIASAEQEAKSAKRGIWAGNPQAPWEWRRRNK